MGRGVVTRPGRVHRVVQGSGEKCGETYISEVPFMWTSGIWSAVDAANASEDN